MRDRIWTEHPWLWVPALAFLVLNLGLVGTYRVLYGGQVQGLESRLERGAERAEAVRAERAERQALLDLATANLESRDHLYSDVLATERQRLTRMIAEVKDLARRSGLEPSDISYPEESYGDFGLRKRSIVFSVGGSYLALRRFANLLELSDSFLMLDEVRLGGDESEPTGDLRIDLRISTLFVEEVSEEPRDDRVVGRTS